MDALALLVIGFYGFIALAVLVGDKEDSVTDTYYKNRRR